MKILTIWKAIIKWLVTLDGAELDLIADPFVSLAQTLISHQ